MTSQRSFVRKIIYFSLIGVLLLPLYALSLPATTQDEGGLLARVRKKNNLSQANLGEIDPTSVTMKLCSFGLHSIAGSLLWSAAIDAKEREDWTTFGAALEQIKNLQPHRVKVWQFQAWNVAFNVSYEFDDYHDRYHHVIKGIELLEQGTRYNDRKPRIVRDLGHFIGFKIGRSDDAEFFRPMFRDDKDFHGTDRMRGTRYAGRPSTLTDNFLVSKWWYQWVDRLLDTKLATYQTLNPAVIHADAPHAQIQYAKSLEQDGHFDDATIDAWRTAGKEWAYFGLRRLPTGQDFSIQLSGLKDQQQQAARLLAEFKKLAAAEPDVPVRLEKERRDALSPQEREALARPVPPRNSKQWEVAVEARRKMLVSPREIALAMSARHRDEAARAADRWQAAQNRLEMTERYRDIVNYEYWRVLCDVECLPQTVATRKAIYDGDQALAASNLPKALDRYTEGIAGWKRVIDVYPGLLEEKSMILELKETIDKYRRVLAQNDGKFPAPFPLQVVLDRYEQLKAAGENEGR